MSANLDNQSDKAAANAEPPSAEDIDDAIEGLEGKDKVGTAGEVLASVGGVAAGATAAGAIAGAVGATTFMGSTALGGLVGGVLVVSTPVGWIVGCALAGGALAYGVTRLIRSGGAQDEARKRLKDRLRKRRDGLRNKGTEESALRQLRLAMAEAVDQRVLDDLQAARMIALVEGGSLPVEVALERVQAILAGPAPEV